MSALGCSQFLARATRQAMRQVYGVLEQFAAREKLGQATIGR